MQAYRIIPTLLLEDGGLVKGIQFKDHRYVGDCLNAVRIFNEKEADELMLLDRSAWHSGIDFDLISKITTQAFMPLSYGGGIKTLEDAVSIFQSGVEKVVLNSATIDRAGLVKEISTRFGNSATVVSIDYKSSGLWGGNKVWYNNGTKNTGINVIDHARRMEQEGAGELLLTSVQREGSMKGYDIDLIRAVAHKVSIPVIASGGAGNITHFNDAIKAGASAVAAGSMCMFWGRLRAVLINYPRIN